MSIYLTLWIRFFAWIVAPLVAVTLGVVVYLKSDLPQGESRVVIEGQQGPIEIIRNAEGVPRIAAQTDADAFWAIGYVHAQERLWQMELQRRLGAGRLSELFGIETLISDEFMRTLGVYRSAKDSWKILTPRAQKSLQAYSDGVNAWLNEDPVLPLEFYMTLHRPEPWSVYDSLVWVKMMALNLGENYRHELLRRLLVQELGLQRASEVLPGYPSDGITILSSLDTHRQSVSDLLEWSQAFQQQMGIGGEYVGSNGWVVHGRHTQSGNPLLVNDPHLPLRIPSWWYLAELQGDSIHVKGATLPGLPYVVLGHNEHIAWGGTSMVPDVQDLYLEKVDSQNPDLYGTEHGLEKMEVVEEFIQVRPPFPSFLREPYEPLVWRSRRTRHGPVISDIFSRLGEPIALRWNALETTDTSYESFLNINYARNWKEFREALRGHVAPNLNFVYADREGNIGYTASGKIPIRQTGNGSLPVPGWSGDHEWIDWIPFDELPHRLNPDTGFLVTANQKIVPDSYPYHLTVDWARPYRAQRIADLLKQKIRVSDKLTVADMATIQGDQNSLQTQELLPFLLRIDPTNAQEREALEYLRNWDGVSDQSSVAAILYRGWVKHLLTEMIEDDLWGVWTHFRRADSLQTFLTRHNPFFLRTVLETDNQTWCDDIQTSESETCQRLVHRAFQQSLEELELLLGNDMEDWHWGELHQAQFNHMPFSEVRVIEKLFHREVPHGGDANTVNVAPANFNDEDEFTQSYGASYRQIIELGKEPRGHFLLPTGQSGNPLSSHYDDLIERNLNLQFLSPQFGDGSPKP